MGHAESLDSLQGNSWFSNCVPAQTAYQIKLHTSPCFVLTTAASLQVFHMVGSPTEMFSPNIAWRTARQWALRKARALQGGSGGGGGGGTPVPAAATGNTSVTTAAAAAHVVR